jgi:glyoxylase-like metal-dependent hydrolase (beta-lactamase superfamily II)
LYVFDCGTLDVDPARFRLAPEEVAVPKLAVPCFLVAHPNGTLVWDPGAVPDAEWTPTGSPVRHHVVIADGGERDVTLTTPFLAQLAAAGYAPGDVTHLALSHYHYDHTANANAFAGATWLVRRAEREAMFAATPPPITRPSTYSALRDSRTILIEDDEHDVFGDGAVVIKAAPGHTPGHQVLYVRLARHGAVVLSGDLYHFPEARTLGRVPTFDFDPRQSVATRAAIEAFLTRTGATLWIQHDFAGNARLRKAPAYYE